MALSQEIIDEFNKAFKKARVAGEPEPTAMVLATSDGKGLVTSRTVLLKALDENGFVFFTNINSTKGRQLAACPRASATFLWKASGCQVQLVGHRVAGSATKPPTPISRRATAAARSAPGRRSSPRRWTAAKRCCGAFVRSKSNTRAERCRAHLSGSASCSARSGSNSGGQREFRLHDRFQYTLEGGHWAKQRLYP